MRPAYDASAITAAEAPLLASLPDGTLMARASFGLARTCARLLGGVFGSSVVVLVGSGNNGGDALFAGAILARRGASVVAVQVADKLHAGGAVALLAAGGRIRSSSSLCDADLIDDADLILDGMLGIGARGGLSGELSRLASMCDLATATVVAVDVPSGVDASTGEVAGHAVTADVTVTFGAMKPGLAIAPGRGHAGLVEVVEVGLSLASPSVGIVDAEDLAELVPHPGAETDKYKRGVVGIAAGSDPYTGAALLAVGGALRTGAGMVRYAGQRAPAMLVRARWPEVVVTEVPSGDASAVVGAGRVQSWVVGSGLGTDEHAGAVVEAVLALDLPVIVDADAITILAATIEADGSSPWLRERTAPTVLTPHAGEFARLRDVDRSDVEARRLFHATAAAAALGVTVLLKGSTTVVADPDGQVRIDQAGSAYLGTAGSGDVLSGIIGALLAAGLGGLDAAAAGSFLHSMAGLIAQGQPAAPILAMDIAAALPAAIRAVRAD